MDQLDLLRKTLKEVDQVSKNILSESAPVMADLSQNEDEAIAMIAERLSKKVPSERIRSALRTMTLEMVNTAQKVADELGDFVRMIVHNDDLANTKETRAVFLRNVYLGDYYDEDSIDALKMLVEELKGIYDNVDINFVIEATERSLQD